MRDGDCPRVTVDQIGLHFDPYTAYSAGDMYCYLLLVECLPASTTHLDSAEGRVCLTLTRLERQREGLRAC